jgi:hypothetical protein
MNKQQVIQTMQEDLSKMPELLKMCRAILNYICSQPEQNLRHITFGALSRAAQLKNMQEIIPASKYLIGTIPLLTPQFEFIEDDFIKDIPLEEVSQARDEGVFYHPRKGEIVPDFESKLFMYFTISPQGKELRNE